MADLIQELEAQFAESRVSTLRQSVGVVREVSDGVARVEGLADVMLNEMVDFGRGIIGLALNLDETEVGAGTILNVAHWEAAVAAGSRFIVSPGTTQELLDAARGSNVPLLPGAATASEVMALREEGYAVLKFFPAEQAGGAAYLKSLSSPLAGTVFCPTGGISLKNARDYLSLPNVVCVGGSWVAPKELVAAGDWTGITKLAAEAAALKG